MNKQNLTVADIAKSLREDAGRFAAFVSRVISSRAGRLGVFLLVFIAIGAASAHAEQFVTYDELTGDIEFNPGWLLAKIINMVVACITAGVPLVLMGMGVAKAMRVFGWLGAPAKR